MVRRGGRKLYKRRCLVKRARKVSGMKPKYADNHSFKLLTYNSNLLNNVTTAVSGGVTTPRASGDVFIGNLVSILPQPTALPTVRNYSFGGSFSFLAQNTNQWSQLNTLFDRYKINGIKLKVIPQMNVSDGSTYSKPIPVMRVVHDYDDNATPTDADVWARRGKEYRLNKPFSLYIKPKVNLQTNVPTGASVVQKAGWIDVAFPNVSHFGLKFAVRDWYTDDAQADLRQVRFEITYYMSFREQINRAVPRAPEPIIGTDLAPVPCESKPEVTM